MFRALCAYHEEIILYYTASGIVTLCRWPFGAQVDLHTGRPPTGMTISDAVQFDLLMTSTTVLKTCTGI